MRQRFDEIDRSVSFFLMNVASHEKASASHEGLLSEKRHHFPVDAARVPYCGCPFLPMRRDPENENGAPPRIGLTMEYEMINHPWISVKMVAKNIRSKLEVNFVRLKHITPKSNTL